tara:strand:+ start:1797 stop:2033 length:237 start_codon:yes stop_codon:yes gene_type:complete
MKKKIKYTKKLWNSYIRTLKKNQEKGITITYPSEQNFTLWLYYNGTKKEYERSSLIYNIIVAYKGGYIYKTIELLKVL